MTQNESIKDYSREYEEESFWQKVRTYAITAGKVVIEKALVLYYCLQDPNTPKWAKSVIIGALGYFIMPLDAIPDLTPIVGFSDDLGALACAMAIVAVHITTKHQEKAREKLNKWFGKSEQADQCENKEM